jgi:protein-arginine kinase activator protein McsA
MIDTYVKCPTCGNTFTVFFSNSVTCKNCNTKFTVNEHIVKMVRLRVKPKRRR